MAFAERQLHVVTRRREVCMKTTVIKLVLSPHRVSQVHYLAWSRCMCSYPLLAGIPGKASPPTLRRAPNERESAEKRPRLSITPYDSIALVICAWVFS